MLAKNRDPRITPMRPDLAAESLRRQVEAPRYAAASERRVTAAIAPLRRAADASAPVETEALFGEAADVYDQRDGWAWVQLQRDGYVGYLPDGCLGPPLAPTHRVAAVRTHVYPVANIKSSPKIALPMGALVRVEAALDRFLALSDGGFAIASHLARLGDFADDFVAVAERFLYAPYLWGGRTSEGVDCSGLVQGALAAAGVAAPRDTDMLENEVGEPVAPTRRDLRRGDLVFWKGHVGIMRNDTELLHANGHAMMVVIEPLEQAVRRTQEKGGGEVTSIRRLKRL